MSPHQRSLALCHSNSFVSFTERGFSHYFALAESSPSVRHEEDCFLTSGSAWTCPYSRQTRLQSSGRRSGHQTPPSGHYYCKYIQVNVDTFWLDSFLSRLLPWMSIVQRMAVGQTWQPTGVAFLTLQGSHSHLKMKIWIRKRLLLSFLTYILTANV